MSSLHEYTALQWITLYSGHSTYEIGEKRFIVLLGDQQVLAGLVVLIRAIVNGFCVTWHELLLVTGLIWFSTTTYLAPLDILREYCREKFSCAMPDLCYICPTFTC